MNYNGINENKIELIGLIYELCPDNVNPHAQLIDKRLAKLLKELRG